MGHILRILAVSVRPDADTAAEPIAIACGTCAVFA